MPQEVARDSGSSPDLPGIMVEGFHNATGRLHVIELVARNAGPSTYYVYTSQSGAWNDSVRGPQGEVTIRNDSYTHQCSWQAFGPGDVLRDDVAWDETVYHGQDDQGRDNPTEAAPQGRYVWTVRLTAWHESMCPSADDKSSIDLTFTVDIPSERTARGRPLQASQEPT